MWPSGYIEGIGPVPGGPRGERNPSGSETAIPLGGASDHSIPTETVVKEEPINEGYGNIFQQSIGAPPVSAYSLPVEEFLGPGEDHNAVERSQSAFNADAFIRQVNVYFQQSRSSLNRSSYASRDSEGAPAERQRIDPSAGLRSRRRSRSPNRHTSESSSTSQMFFPERTRTSTPPTGHSISSRNSLPTVLDTSRANTPDVKIEEEQTDVRSRCQCPISVECAHRRADHLDCRPLVLESKSWGYRKDQDAFDVKRAARSFGEKTHNLDVIIRILGLLDDFDAAENRQARKRVSEKIEDWLHDMADATITAGEQQTAITQQILPRLTNFLLPEVIAQRGNANPPPYVEEEFRYLIHKWVRGDFDGNIYRGLLENEQRNINEHVTRVRRQVDPSWQFYKNGRVFGDNGLINGQLFTSREELMRDGAHAPPQGGISGTSKNGAYSVLCGKFNQKTNKGYADIDRGNILDYIGTALEDQEGLGPTNVADPHMHNPGAWDRSPTARKPTVATRALMRSLETGIPVRVIRSCEMCDVVTNKPHQGYRYDGLYRVVEKSALKEARQIWSFRLERVNGQGPLRGFRDDDAPRDSAGRRRAHFHARR